VIEYRAVDRQALRITIILTIMVIALLAIGWIGFVHFEKMDNEDAFGATINILSTVGLGSTPASTPQGRFLVIILQIGAVSIVAVAVATLSQATVLGTLRQYLGRYRMDERIHKLNEHFIVVGYSLTGETITQDLASEGQPFLVIEKNPEVITKLEERGLLFVEGDATDEAILKKAGIQRARGLFAVLSSDSDNLMVVLSARGLNESLVIVSKSTREDYAIRFRRAGADAAISPQEWASRRMIQAVLRPNLLQLLSILLDPNVSDASLDEVKVPGESPVAGKVLSESRIREASGIVILGIVRRGKMEPSPGPDTRIEEGDVLIGYGRQENFRNLEMILRKGRVG
jgi:voltage-gated potassium channel